MTSKRRKTVPWDAKDATAEAFLVHKVNGNTVQDQDYDAARRRPATQRQRRLTGSDCGGRMTSPHALTTFFKSGLYCIQWMRPKRGTSTS